MDAGLCAAYGIPANNKAVIANSLTVSQPLQDFSSPLKAMLLVRGYDVQTVDADLDFFKRLTEFGVIVIEAHGAVKPYFTVQDVLGSKSTGVDPTCSSQGGSMVLWTPTPVTRGSDGNFGTYVSDVVCGWLRVVTTTVRRVGQKPFSTTVYGVTPNFVRKYAQGNFPSHTLLCLSACRGLRQPARQRMGGPAPRKVRRRLVPRVDWQSSLGRIGAGLPEPLSACGRHQRGVHGHQSDHRNDVLPA